MADMARAKACREERKSIAESMRKLLETVEAEKRSLSPEELDQFDRWEVAVKDLEREFNAIEKAAATIAAADARQDHIDRLDWAGQQSDDVVSYADEDLAFRGWLLYDTPHFTAAHERAIKKCQLNPAYATRQFEMPRIGIVGGPNDSRKIRTVQDVRQLRMYAANVITTRATTAQTITTTGGGNLVANDNNFAAQLQESLLTGGSLRDAATVITTDTGATLPIPGHAGNDKGAIVAINTAVVTQDTSYSQQTLAADKYTSNMIKLPSELIQDSAIDIQGHVAQKVGDRIRRYQEEMWATGEASAAEPEGLVTSGSSGGAAAGSVAQSSEANVTYTDLTNLEHDVDPLYRPASSWMFHDSVLKNVKQQLDGNSRPLWNPSLTANEPDLLLGYPYRVNQEYGAFTGTSANPTKLMTFGRHSDYWIRDVRGVDVRVLRERYGELDQIAVLGFARADGVYINPTGGSSLSSIKYMTSATS